NLLPQLIRAGCSLAHFGIERRSPAVALARLFHAAAGSSTVPLIGALVIKEFQTWLRGRLTFAAFTLLVLLVALLVFLLGVLILAPDANAAPALFSTTSTT